MFKVGGCISIAGVIVIALSFLMAFISDVYIDDKSVQPRYMLFVLGFIAWLAGLTLMMITEGNI